MEEKDGWSERTGKGRRVEGREEEHKGDEGGKRERENEREKNKINKNNSLNKGP